jgi:hypothetical protein
MMNVLVDAGGENLLVSYFWTTMRWVDCSPVSGEIILMV